MNSIVYFDRNTFHWKNSMCYPYGLEGDIERRQEVKRVRVKITLHLKRRGLDLKEHVCNLTIALKSAR